MSIRWDSENDWKNNQDSSGTTGRNGNLRQGYRRDRPPLSDGLVGYWPLHDENATDYSGNGNHGTKNGGVTTGVAGKAGLQAMSFDGSDDYVAMSQSSETSIGTGDFTVSFWIKLDKLATDEGENFYIFHRRESVSTNEFAVLVNSGDNSISHAYPGVESFNGDTKLSKDIWYHVTCVRNGDSHYIYINGSEDGSLDRSAVDISTTNNLNIGRHVNDARYTHGNISQVRFYNRALSDSEIQTLYDWGHGDYARPPSDGISYYKLDGDATDSWSGNDGTTNGGLSWTKGVRGQAASFDGSDDYIDTGYIPGAAFTSDFTISCWFKARSWGGNGSGRLLSNREQNDYGIEFFPRDDATLRFTDLNAGDAATPVQLNEYYHAVGVNHRGTFKLYLNGTLQDTHEATLQESSNPLHIGNRAKDSARHFDGKIDDVRIYSYALSSSEIFEIYRYGTRGRDMRKFLVTH